MLTIVTDQRGSILPIMAAVVAILIAVAAVALDLTRYTAAREKLQTAGDAAAVAASMSVTRYVELYIDRGRDYDCCGMGDECDPCCRTDCGEITVTGREKDLLDNKGWKQYCCGCGCEDVKVVDRWVENENYNVETVAEMFFGLNKPKEMSPEKGGESYISSIVPYLGELQREDPRYPSVVVKTRGKVKTLFLDFINRLYPGADMSYINASECSQGIIFYYDQNGKWHRAAADACN
jgi:hypothetical protein